jgi:hypothetical protein
VTETVEQGATTGVYDPQKFARFMPAVTLLQLEYEPTFAAKWYSYPYARLPEFTLLSDGRLIYLADSWPDESLQIVQLSPQEKAALLQDILDLGIEELENYTDFCVPQADGTEQCIADAAYTILWQRMPDDSFKQIRS